MIDLDNNTLNKLWEIFKEQGEEAITWNHYELAERTEEHNPEIWKTFLMDPTIAAWIQSELNIIQNTELKKMVKGASSTRSVGQAQLINAFSKLNETSGTKEGPVFIYSHVPLNNQQKHAPDVRELKNNPFVRQED